MPIQRQTAKKVRAVDLISGEWVKKEGMEPSYVITPAKENIARARIAGTVVGKFTSEDGNFSSITLDDSTASIRAKLWREIELLNTVQVGDLVNLIGKVREYEGEIYIVPEIITKITPDQETLFRLEVLELIKKRSGNVQEAPKEEPTQPAQAPPETKEPQAKPEPAAEPVKTQTPPAPQQAAQPEPIKEEPAKAPEPAAEAKPEAADAKPEPPKPQEEEKPEPAEGENLRKKVLTLIEGSQEGIKYSELMQQSGAPEEDLEGVINELLGEGVCYEPTPGKIKKI